jgi:hypothetical protein
MNPPDDEFPKALQQAIAWMEKARGFPFGDPDKPKYVPLEPEIKALRRYLELYAKKDWDLIVRRPASDKKLERARDHGRRGGQRKSRRKKKSSRENLRKWREEKARDAVAYLKEKEAFERAAKLAEKQEQAAKPSDQDQ